MCRGLKETEVNLAFQDLMGPQLPQGPRDWAECQGAEDRLARRVRRGTPVESVYLTSQGSQLQWDLRG